MTREDHLQGSTDYELAAPLASSDMEGVHRIAIAGFGNVGQALARLIAERNPAASNVVIVGVSDPRFGTVASHEGIDVGELLTAVSEEGFEAIASHMPGAGVLDMVGAAGADTLVELSVTDLETAEPATTHVRQALSAGLNVSTTNKGPIALHHTELRDLAQANGVTLAFEGTVMSGTPVIAMAGAMQNAGLTALNGVLNGTTNFILTLVEGGSSYEDALALAQSHGYAEADPAGDIEGHDSAAKLVILAEVLLGATISLPDVERLPIFSVAPEQIQQAKMEGDSYRYLSTLDGGTGEWHASVAPRRLPAAHPLTRVAGAGNGVTLDTELLGEMTLFGPGAGPTPTAFAVLSDLNRIVRESAG